MNRRKLLMTASAVVGTALAGLRAGPSMAATAYTPGAIKAALDRGETVFVDFKASWCTTCAAQARVLAALKDENPNYEKAVTFIDVDWDTYKNADITRALNIPRRSTLLVLKGNSELGRIVAGTSRAQIKALMDTALAAATSS